MKKIPNGWYIDEYGNKFHYLNDFLHCEDGPAVINTDGTQSWYVNGVRHREDGPAFININEHQEWFLNGKHHREDGPAVIWKDGKQAWFVNGNRISDEEIKRWKDQYNIPENYLEWNSQHKMLFKLKFS